MSSNSPSADTKTAQSVSPVAGCGGLPELVDEAARVSQVSTQLSKDAKCIVFCNLDEESPSSPPMVPFDPRVDVGSDEVLSEAFRFNRFANLFNMIETFFLDLSLLKDEWR